jgi:hypothetical protein
MWFCRGVADSMLWEKLLIDQFLHQIQIIRWETEEQQPFVSPHSIQYEPCGG